MEPDEKRLTEFVAASHTAIRRLRSFTDKGTIALILQDMERTRDEHLDDLHELYERRAKRPRRRSG